MINHGIAQYTLLVSDVITGLNHITTSTSLNDEHFKIATEKLFNFDYGLSPENKRLFEYNFLLKFLNREICSTPLYRWQYQLKSICLMNGTKWEMLLNASRKNIEWDKPYNTVEENIFNGNINEKSTNNGNTNSIINDKQTDTLTSTSEVVGSDLPQTTLNGLDYASNSTTSKNNDTSTNNKQQNSNTNTSINNNVDKLSTSKNTLNKKGNTGFDYSTLLQNYKETVFSGLDYCFKDCECLFFSIY